jgi:hypothetical protein
MSRGPGRGPYGAVGNQRCRSCGLLLGTNRGRCQTCFDAYGDDELSKYFDWLLRNALPPACSRKMAEANAEHGPLLIPNGGRQAEKRTAEPEPPVRIRRPQIHLHGSAHR